MPAGRGLARDRTEEVTEPDQDGSAASGRGSADSGGHVGAEAAGAFTSRGRSALPGGSGRADCWSRHWRSPAVSVDSAGGGVHIEPRYRQYPQLTKSQVFQAELLSATMWFWILWRFWHDSDAVLGHFPYPDPSQWTDEELGIPPDDED
ncbi:NADH dehydrogenase [ubiquinone] 1 beta subcomplex subunit 2, mitochondrial isoform X1 [Petaurus breviceps papuanus]|uniref:NADH dehydrogenase [ubiquinone] 1 beta subcomplex subunit 2, mitochondrial isoform X1 n=1 Tax=Petaurus breviceps papuanus TaxID=3040969 RepID=UPI0036DCECB1